jgi:replicative DNA helicase
MILCDTAAERAVLAGICSYGQNAYLDVADILQPTSFTVDSNSIIFQCLKRLFENDHKTSIDIASIYSTAQELNVAHILNKKEEAQHLKAIMDFPVSEDNVRKFAAKIRKLEIARLLYKQLEDTKDKILDVSGNEPISSIIGIAEDSIFNFTSLLNDADGDPEHIASNIDDYITGLIENKVDQVGIPTGFPVYDQSIGGGLRKGTVNIIGARPKAQPLDAKILTPNGWKLMEDIKIGDVLVDPSQKNGTCKVIGVYPFGKREVLEFTFSDGSKTQACKSHIWKVKNRRWKDYQNISFNDMIDISTNNSIFEYDGRPKWQFPLSKPIFRNSQTHDHYIDPYVLGCFLGDGCITQNNIMFSSNDKNLINTINLSLKDDYYLKHIKDYDYRLTTYQSKNKFRIELSRLGLHGKNSYTKFIPDEYLNSSISDRQLLLQGLFDTDGHANNGNIIEYLTASKQLSIGVKDIVLSLGGLCTTKIKKVKYKNQIKKYYRLYIKFNDISEYFRLKRKKQSCSKRSKPDLKRSLVGVKSLGKKFVQCIKVDSLNGLYVTDDYIVTHNTGKTLLSDNMGFNIAKLGIPVLNMDTEMTKEDHINRLLAMIAEVEINNIETGKFSDSPDKVNKILSAKEELKKCRLSHKSIAGKPFEDQLAIMRRWLVKEVGLNDDGTAKDCVIFYDYLKLMDSAGISQDLKEYQLLGFMMTSLHNFAVRYKVPIMAFIQLNRDGITKESTDSASGSDRIIWLCSNFSIFKRKSDEEIAEDGADNGNRKLLPIVSRHGGGLDDNDYINCYMKGWCAKITEGKTKLELMSGKKTKDEGFIVDDEKDNDQEIPFD